MKPAKEWLDQFNYYQDGVNQRYTMVTPKDIIDRDIEGLEELARWRCCHCRKTFPKSCDDDRYWSHDDYCREPLCDAPEIHRRIVELKEELEAMKDTKE